MKAPRQKISSASRWLINIGLTLQFYIPCAFCLCYIYRIAYMLFTEPHDSVGNPQPVAIVIGFGVAGIMMMLVILAVPTVWCTIYLLWDRYGNRFNALCLLIATNVLLGGLWFLLWINVFAPGTDLGFWLLSPAPIVIPTLLYYVALRLLFPKNGTGVSEPKS